MGVLGGFHIVLCHNHNFSFIGRAFCFLCCVLCNSSRAIYFISVASVFLLCIDGVCYCEELSQLCCRMTFCCWDILLLSSNLVRFTFRLIILKFACLYFGNPVFINVLSIPFKSVEVSRCPA